MPCRKAIIIRHVFNEGPCVTWPQPKSAPFGGACPSQHHVAVGHQVNSQHQRCRSTALGKGLCPGPVEPARCGWGRRGPWLQGGHYGEARDLGEMSVKVTGQPQGSMSLVLLSHSRDASHLWIKVSGQQHFCLQQSQTVKKFQSLLGLFAKIKWRNLRQPQTQLYKTNGQESSVSGMRVKGTWGAAPHWRRLKRVSWMQSRDGGGSSQ